MKKNELKVPDVREKFKNLMKLCTLIFWISSVTANLNSLQAQQPQTREISGTVTDTKGQPIPATSVVVKGTTIGINTDINGKFKLNVPVDAQTLVFSFIGMKPQEVSIGGISTVSVRMENETVGLEEVVVVGYGTQKKVTVTGAVATISNAQLVQAPVANVSTMIVGRTPGLLSVQRTGEPGEDFNDLQIRGVSTFTGSQSPLILVDGIETQNYNNIDPNEIENIAILKDASATAVYGIRGANGVLIITTKRGKIGKPVINFSSNFAVNQLVEFRGRMRGYDYTNNWNEALKYESYLSGSYKPMFPDEDIQHWKDGDDPLYHPDVDWVKLCLRDYAFQNQQNVTVRGGKDKLKYFISAGRFHEDGLENNTNLNPDFFDYQTKFDRYNFRSNFDYDVTKRLTVSMDLSNQTEQKGMMYPGNLVDEDTGAWIRMISLSNPVQAPGIVDGKILANQTPWAPKSNALGSMYGSSGGGNGYMKRYRNYLNGSVKLNYDLDFITKGLSARVTLSYKNNNVHKMRFNKPTVTYTLLDAKAADGSPIIVPNNDEGPFSSWEYFDKFRSTYAEIGLDYARSFGDHNITGLLLYNQNKKFDPGLQYMIPTGYQGLVGRIVYDYKGRYLAELNAGYNGTENFAEGKRFGFFPAYSMGWVLSREPFFPKNNIVTFVKFRGSYGEVGNDKIGGSRFLYMPSTYTYSNDEYYFGLVGISSSSYRGAYEAKVGNPVVTWERAKKTDIGIELTLFKEKVKLSADWFDERRDNILITNQNIAIIIGVGSNLPATNSGKMKNSGIDGEVTINLTAGKFNYWIAGNYTYAHNNIVYKAEVYNPYSYLYVTGQRNGQNFGPVEVDGLYNSWMEVNDAYRPLCSYQNNKLQPGDIHWKDINGDGVFDTFDEGPIGYSDFPEINYSFSFGGDLKGFDFSAMFQGAANVSFDARDKYTMGWQSNQMTSDYLSNSWSLERYEAGLPIYFPHFAVGGNVFQNNSMVGTFFVVDARYIRLRNAEIGYTFNENNLFTTIGISSARIYVNGNNLFVYAPVMNKMFPNVDPEFTSTRPSVYGSGVADTNREPYPKMRTINFGAYITF